MVIDGNYIQHGEHYVMYKIVKSLYCTPETSITYVNDPSVNQSILSSIKLTYLYTSFFNSQFYSSDLSDFPWNNTMLY